jgi:hypothetical protein
MLRLHCPDLHCAQQGAKAVSPMYRLGRSKDHNVRLVAIEHVAALGPDG